MNVNVLKKNISIMRNEIHSQPELLKKSYMINKRQIIEISQLIKSYVPRAFYFTARGSSEHAGLLAQHVMEIYGGIPVKIINSSTITLYGSNLQLEKSVVIGISQSGSAEDVARVLCHARAKGAMIISITNVRGLVDKTAEYNIANNVGKENVLPVTKTYMSQAVILLAIIANVIDDKSLMISIDRIPDAIIEGIKLEDSIREYANYYRYSNEVDIISRGIISAAMAEAELKIQETGNVNAHAYSASDYAYGPFAITNPSRPYIFTLVNKVTDSVAMSMNTKMSKKDIFAMGITNKKNCQSVSDSIAFA
jgi:glucosamine--fructose-6-phosphate aminotransferase (isomerizing)